MCSWLKDVSNPCQQCLQAFQLLPEYLQILENYSGLSAVQEMGQGVEAWLAQTILKLDTHLLGVGQTFNEESYLAVIDAYALMGDIGRKTCWTRCINFHNLVPDVSIGLLFSKTV